MAKDHLMRNHPLLSILTFFIPFFSIKDEPEYPTSKSEQTREDIVIVGGGVAGLATAASLHSKRIPLRTGGASLGLMKNAWKALDAIAVGDQLRGQFFEIDKIAIRTEKGRELRSFGFKDEDKSSQELRSVERKVLLQTLADQLPSNTIQFNSKLSKIEKAKTGETLLELVNGTRLSAKIVVGCDGIWSPIS
ncbi:hypothetical protein Ancab_033265 [Ancistrocladus abbreviatus]